MSENVIHPAALAIAVKATGLRPDQVECAVAAYREAIARVEAEPDWHATVSMSGRGVGLFSYSAEGTEVLLNVEEHEARDGSWEQHRTYIFNGEHYEHFAEARAVELAKFVRPKPYRMPTSAPAPAPSPPE